MIKHTMASRLLSTAAFTVQRNNRQAVVKGRCTQTAPNRSVGNMLEIYIIRFWRTYEIKNENGVWISVWIKTLTLPYSSIHSSINSTYLNINTSIHSLIHSGVGQ